LRFPLLLPIICLSAFAHDLEVNARLAPPSVVVKSTYAGSEPVPFAKVQVFSPAAVEFQNANTDKRGMFSFIPDSVGTWRVVIDDELGHRRETTVQVDSLDSGAASASSTGASRLERALLGLSLLIGLTGFWYGFQSRKLAKNG
jgi:nickel transport protein